MKNNEKVFCVFNNNQKMTVMFVKEFKEKNKYDKAITYKLDETKSITQEKLLLLFLTADFENEKAAEKTFFKYFTDNLKDKIKHFNTIEELMEFQKKFRYIIDFVFSYEINDKEYNLKFKEHMRYSEDCMSLRYLRNQVEVLFDVEINEENQNYEKNLIQPVLKYSNDIYIVKSLPALLYMTLKEYVTFENLPIRKCKNCGKYFVAQKRRDELYCTRIFGDTNKTCKQIGSAIAYEEKLDNDPALMLYRNMSKRKYMKATRNPENTEIQEKYQDWKEKARNKYEKYKSSKITADQFLKWLEENEF